jgi:hypothetical protein
MRHSNHRQFRGKTFVMHLEKSDGDKTSLTVDSIHFVKNEVAEIKQIVSQFKLDNRGASLEQDENRTAMRE